MYKSMSLFLLAMIGCNGFAEPSELVPQVSDVRFDALGERTVVRVTYVGQNISGPSTNVVKWETADPSVATVGVGLEGEPAIISVGNGETVVTAKQLGRTATIRVAVSQRPVSLVAGPVIPITLTSLQVGQVLQAFATSADRLGTNIVNPPVVWSTLSPSVLSITPSGQVTAIAAGQGIVLARLGALSTQLNFVVR